MSSIIEPPPLRHNLEDICIPTASKQPQMLKGPECWAFLKWTDSNVLHIYKGLAHSTTPPVGQMSSKSLTPPPASASWILRWVWTIVPIPTAKIMNLAVGWDICPNTHHQILPVGWDNCPNTHRQNLPDIFMNISLILNPTSMSLFNKWTNIFHETNVQKIKILLLIK